VQDRADGVGQVDVVDRDLERVLRRGDPVGERVRDLLGGLAAVGEGADVYCVVFAARCAVLWARFAAWYSVSASGESTSPSVVWLGASGSAAVTP
jgi:hypothetical protein